MTKRSTKRPSQRGIRQKARGGKNAKPAANKARPPRPTNKLDVKDIERADSEGMAQPQGVTTTQTSRA